MKGVSPQVVRKLERAAAWLIEALAQGEAHMPPLPLALPRRAGNYSASAIARVPHGYRVISRSLNALQALGWAEVTTGVEGVAVTRVRSSGNLKDHCVALAHQWVPRPAGAASELLYLTTHMSDGRKTRRPLLDDESDELATMRNNLQRINDVLRSQCIHIRAPDQQLMILSDKLARHEPTDGRSKVRAVQYGQVSLYRTFSSSLALGGRFYGGWWQNAPRWMRPYIWINEWQGIECDFSGMAIRCLYAREGLSVPDDPYDIGLNYRDADPRREVVKEYINAMLNDKKGVYQLGPQQLRILGLSRKEVARRVREAHAGIAHHFHTDAGLQMQRTDSDIAERVMLKMLDMGAVCLPIHDSFIVQVPYAIALVRVMAETFKEITGADARMKGVDPALTRHYAESSFSAAQANDVVAVRERISKEFERFSISNTYFGSWADQMWGAAGWDTAMKKLDFVPPALLAHHAFPLTLFYVDEEKEEGAGGDPGACSQCSSSFPVTGMDIDRPKSSGS